MVSQPDIVRVNRATVAWALKKFPQEVDNQPAQDIWDVLGVMEDEAERAKG